MSAVSEETEIDSLLYYVQESEEKYLVVVVIVPNDAIFKNAVMIWEADQWQHLHIDVREGRWDEDVLELVGCNGHKEHHTWLHHSTRLWSEAQDSGICSFFL